MTARRAFRGRVILAVVVSAGTLAGLGPAPVPPAAAAAAPGTITTFAGGVGEGPALNLSVGPESVAARGGLIYFADPGHAAVRVLDTATGEVRTVAGNGFALGNASHTPRGDGGPATAARLVQVAGVAVDGTGRIYAGDYGDNRVRRVDLQGVVTTFATGVSPEGLAMDAQDNLFVASGVAVVKITPAGAVTTVIGANCPCGDQNGDLDGTPALDASTENHRGMALDPAGRLHVTIGDRVYKVDDAGILRRVAGGGSVEDGRGDGGPARAAHLFDPAASPSTLPATCTSPISSTSGSGG